uniref:Putative secreted protein n=1 Tax=Rhipicephalus microplus TaxID=6941 RepID=A0A6G5A1L0_RHIMP
MFVVFSQQFAVFMRSFMVSMLLLAVSAYIYREKNNTVTRYMKGSEFYCTQSSKEKLLLRGTLTAVTLRLLWKAACQKVLIH